MSHSLESLHYYIKHDTIRTRYLWLIIPPSLWRPPVAPVWRTLSLSSAYSSRLSSQWFWGSMNSRWSGKPRLPDCSLCPILYHWYQQSFHYIRLQKYDSKLPNSVTCTNPESIVFFFSNSPRQVCQYVRCVGNRSLSYLELPKQNPRGSPTHLDDLWERHLGTSILL